MQTPLARRNFGEADYEALLELDSQLAMARPQLSEAELGRLHTHIHRLKAEAPPKHLPRLLPGTPSGCADKVRCMCNCKLPWEVPPSVLACASAICNSQHTRHWGLLSGHSCSGCSSCGFDMSKAGFTEPGWAAYSETLVSERLQ